MSAQNMAEGAKPPGRYRKVEVRTWGDEKFRALSPIPPCGQGVWLYLIVGPRTGPIPGLFSAGPATMAEDLNWPIEAFREAFAEAFREGMVQADFLARVVWVPKAIKHNPPASPNVVRNWGAEFDLIPECDLKRTAYEELRTSIYAVGEPFGKAFDESWRKPSPKPLPKPSRKALGNQYQEQEQKQKQEQNYRNTVSSADADSSTQPSAALTDPPPDGIPNPKPHSIVPEANGSAPEPAAPEPPPIAPAPPPGGEADPGATPPKRRAPRQRRLDGSEEPECEPIPDCPYTAIVERYHERLPGLPRVVLLKDARKAAIRKLWSWVFKTPLGDGRPRATSSTEGIAWFDRYFERVTHSDFLMGRTTRANGHESWRADIDFLLSDRGQKHVIERTETRSSGDDQNEAAPMAHAA